MERKILWVGFCRLICWDNMEPRDKVIQSMTVCIHVCTSKWHHGSKSSPWTPSPRIGVEGREDTKLNRTTEDISSVVFSAFTNSILASSWTSRGTDWSIDSPLSWPKAYPKAYLIPSPNPYSLRQSNMKLLPTSGLFLHLATHLHCLWNDSSKCTALLFVQIPSPSSLRSSSSLNFNHHNLCKQLLVCEFFSILHSLTFLSHFCW